MIDDFWGNAKGLKAHIENTKELERQLLLRKGEDDVGCEELGVKILNAFNATPVLMRGQRVLLINLGRAMTEAAIIAEPGVDDPGFIRHLDDYE